MSGLANAMSRSQAFASFDNDSGAVFDWDWDGIRRRQDKI